MSNKVDIGGPPGHEYPQYLGIMYFGLGTIY